MLSAVWLAFALAAPAAAEGGYGWRLAADRWSAADETGFSDFVQAIGDSDCETPNACLSAPANPLAAGDPPGLDFTGDCADFAYMLRAYYAWKKGLPFGFVVRVRPRGGEGDPRESPEGNAPVERFDVARDGADIRDVLARIRGSVSTATLRVEPVLSGAVAPDHVEAALAPGAIRPGALIYDADGHVVIVTRVEPDGRIRYVDSQTDFVLSRGVLMALSAPRDRRLGAGFKVWRGLQAVDGRLVAAPDPAPVPDDARQYRADETDVAFTRRARERLAVAPIRRDAAGALREGLDSLCAQARSRVRYVEAAHDRGLDRIERPGRLGGVAPVDRELWERHSTIGRDRRLRRNAVWLASELRDLGGGRDLLPLFRELSAACPVRWSSDSGPEPLADILARLPAMSFDPWACPARRWGLEDGLGCAADPLAARWHAATRTLRNDLDGRTSAGSATLADLEAEPARFGPADAPGPTLESVIGYLSSAP